MKAAPIFLSVFMMFMLCLCQAKPVIKGSGTVKQESRVVSSFTRIVISDAIQVILMASDAESVMVEAEDNVLPYVTIETGGDKLNIKMKETHSITTEKGVKVYVSYKHLAELFVSGASKITATGTLQTDKLLLIVSDASHVDADVKTQWLSVNCSAGSKAVISGQTEKLNIQCTGASNVNARKLKAQDADAEVSGASTVTLDTKNKLNITASGASVVRYLCDSSTLITKTISGASSIVALKAGNTE